MLRDLLCEPRVLAQTGTLMEPHTNNTHAVILASGKAVSVCAAEESARIRGREARERAARKMVAEGGGSERGDVGDGAEGAGRGNMCAGETKSAVGGGGVGGGDREETGGKMGGCSGMLLQRPRDIPRVFRLLDTNSDGKLSLGLCPGRTSAS